MLHIVNGSFAGSYAGNAGAIRNRTGAELIIDDGDFFGGSAVYSDGKVTINGGYFHSIACLGIPDENDKTGNLYSYAFISNGDLIFNNGTVEGVQGGMSISGGTAVVKDGVFKTVACEHENPAFHTHYALYIAGSESIVEARIEGGTYTSYDKVAAYIGNDTPGDGGIAAKATAHISGGTFIGGPGVNGKALFAGKITGNPLISGGFFSSDVSDYVVEGSVQAPDGLVGSPEEVAVASLTKSDGSVETYTDLHEAIEAAKKSGGTVVLKCSVSLPSWDQIWNVFGITIDGGGHTLKVNGIESLDNHNALIQSDGGNAIKNIVIDLSDLKDDSPFACRAFDAANGDVFSGVTIKGNGNLDYGISADGSEAADETVTIDRCTFEGMGYAVYDSEIGLLENLKVTNSTIANCEYAVIMRSPSGVFSDNTVTGGKFNACAAGVTASGNTFKGESRIKFYAAPKNSRRTASLSSLILLRTKSWPVPSIFLKTTGAVVLPAQLRCLRE